MTNDQLNTVLGYFITEVRNKKGLEYYPNTLYELIICIQRFLRQNDRSISILDDRDFSALRSVLDSKMKELSRNGIGLKTKKADVISADQETYMWSNNILGTDTPKKLCDTLLYCIGLNFALRAGQEHRNLRVGTNSQISLKISPTDGRKYLEYTEDVSKTNCGGLEHRKIQSKVVRAYQNTDCPERCIINMYQKYMSLRPNEGKCQAFYLRSKKYPTSDEWYDDCPIGVHQLQKTVSDLCKGAQFSGNFTNHSLRATAATRLYAAGVDEQLISEKTGHRSSAVRGHYFDYVAELAPNDKDTDSPPDIPLDLLEATLIIHLDLLEATLMAFETDKKVEDEFVAVKSG
ncbi:unnamed protein product [Mytilus edulis]|uniref:DUF3504 domain-containing protein n=1 Tax=Mytilus edulis TaxID=6550 RepID=A0A8S3TSF0_MYTED|nr:unnamed protein product [Mytilus edulis]